MMLMWKRNLHSDEYAVPFVRRKSTVFLREEFSLEVNRFVI
jgi:hypothetical protein